LLHLAVRNDSIKRFLDFLALSPDFLAPSEDVFTPSEDFLAFCQDFLAPSKEFFTLSEDFLAFSKDFFTPSINILARSKEVGARSQECDTADKKICENIMFSLAKKRVNNDKRFNAGNGITTSCSLRKTSGSKSANSTNKQKITYRLQQSVVPLK
jgi:hypothetical protein